MVAVWLFVAMLLGSGSLSRAEVVANLYRVVVPVESQSQQELRRAAQDALAELFVRVSGREAILTDGTIVNAIKNAQRYTKKFGYDRIYDEQSGEQLRMVLDFEPQLVEDTLRGAGLPLWSSNRPTVLIWLAVEDAAGRHFAGPEREPVVVKAILDNARRRGLAVKLPALDLTDMVALSPEALWTQDEASIARAVERYPHDTLLTGRVTRLNNGHWIGRWSFDVNGQRQVFDHEAGDIDSYIAAGLNRVAEVLSMQYAIVPVKIAEGGVLLRLTGVRGFVDYARAIRYLEDIVAIHHANAISLEGDELIVRLTADGELAQLQQAFALDKRLLPQPQSDYTGPYPIALNYQWPSVVTLSTEAAVEIGEEEQEVIDASQLPDMETLQP